MFTQPIVEHHAPVQIATQEAHACEDVISQEEVQNNSLPNIFEVQAEIATKAPDFHEKINLCRNNPLGYPPVAYAVTIGRHDVAKFLIDHNESANATLATHNVYHDWVSDTSDDAAVSYLKGQQPGYTPLELAIRANDYEMVNILLTHNPTNFADSNHITNRFYDEYLYRGPHLTRSSGGYAQAGAEVTKLADHHPYGGWQVGYIFKTGGPLAEALSVGNNDIVACLIRSYKTEESLLNAYEQIRRANKEDLMRLWLEQKHYILGEEYPIVSDDTVRLYLTSSLQNAVLARDVTLVEQFLSQPTGRHELEKSHQTAYAIGAYDILELIEAKLVV